MKFTISIALLLLTVTNICFSQQNSDSIKITYIANTGFLLETQNHKVLIDALFGEEELSFCQVPSKSMIRKLNNKGIIKKIDALLVTHYHVDHFDKKLVTDFLIAHPETTFIGSHQTTDSLLYENSKGKLIEKQIKTSYPEFGSTQRIDLSGIAITVFPFRHGAFMKTDENGKRYNKHDKVRNVGFLVEMDGIKILHTGDANSITTLIEHDYQLKKYEIDVALLGRGFINMMTKDNIESFKNYLNPKNVILNHIRPKNIEPFQKYTKSVSEFFPNIYMFKSQDEFIHLCIN